MNLDQRKIQLAVLYKLHKKAEGDGRAIDIATLTNLFSIDFPIRRLEFALDALESRGSAESHWHPYQEKVLCWLITKDGMDEVDRALKLPKSFIYRLDAGCDEWLESEEAEKAILQKIAKQKIEETREAEFIKNGSYVLPVPPLIETDNPRSKTPSVHITNTVNPTFSNQNSTNSANDPEAIKVARSGNRATWISLGVTIVAIIFSLYFGGKLSWLENLLNA